jgi:hypothetical protein
VTPDQLEHLRVDVARRGIRVTVAGLLRVADAARFLDRSPKTLRNWRAAGDGPTHTAIGGLVYYSLQDLVAFVEAGRGRPARPETSRNDLAAHHRPAETDRMHIAQSRLSTALPVPVADAIRAVAVQRGVGVGELLAEALRSFPPVAAAVATDNTSNEERNEQIRSAP